MCLQIKPLVALFGDAPPRAPEARACMGARGAHHVRSHTELRSVRAPSLPEPPRATRLLTCAAARTAGDGQSPFTVKVNCVKCQMWLSQVRNRNPKHTSLSSNQPSRRRLPI
eukprot:1436806-Prymnesium_polylepis.1